MCGRATWDWNCRRCRSTSSARALSIAQADPKTSLFVDDREQNIAPAHALGMVAILFKSAEQLRSDLEQALQLEFPGA